jgi:sec-independent protein translocase protein TatA
MRIESWQWIVILVIVLLFWGAPKLPALTKSVAESLKIFRKEIKNDSDKSPEAKVGEEGEKKKD